MTDYKQVTETLRNAKRCTAYDNSPEFAAAIALCERAAKLPASVDVLAALDALARTPHWHPRDNKCSNCEYGCSKCLGVMW